VWFHLVKRRAAVHDVPLTAMGAIIAVGRFADR
jgi:hypothetical protein